jgi:hypothetical protein
MRKIKVQSNGFKCTTKFVYAFIFSQVWRPFLTLLYLSEFFNHLRLLAWYYILPPVTNPWLFDWLSKKKIYHTDPNARTRRKEWKSIFFFVIISCQIVRTTLLCCIQYLSSNDLHINDKQPTIIPVEKNA